MNQTNQSNQAIIGIFLGGKTLKLGKVQHGEISKSNTIKINNRASEQEILSIIINQIESIIDPEVVGIGFGVPSLVDVKNGIVYKVINIPSWREVHLKDILKNKFNINIYVNNDANCFAIGEKYYGLAQNYQNIVGLILGTGVGSGIIFNEHLFSGTNCGAGEFGSISYKKRDYEYYCSENFFLEKYGLNFEVVYQRALQNDKVALAIFEQYGTSVGEMIKTILFAIDPQIIVIGGTISKAMPFFKEAMWEQIENFPYENSLEKLKIRASENEHIEILGAAALYFDANNQTLIK